MEVAQRKTMGMCYCAILVNSSISFVSPGGLCKQVCRWRSDGTWTGPGRDQVRHQPWTHCLSPLHWSFGIQWMPHHHRYIVTHTNPHTDNFQPSDSALYGINKYASWILLMFTLAHPGLHVYFTCSVFPCGFLILTVDLKNWKKEMQPPNLLAGSCLYSWE